MLGKYENIDRRIKEPDLEPLDAVMLTLDVEKYLEKTLDATYRELPVNKFFVIDGGSKDSTVEILKKYPRMEIHVRPDIRTTGKGFEFLFNITTTPWIIFVDCAKVPTEGWYDEMMKYKSKYDFFGSKRIVHYEFEREDPTTTDINKRPLGGPWLIRKKSIKGYHVDDDYAWRMTDVLIRQVVEKNGYKYGAVSSTHHICYISDEKKYESDEEKRGSQLVFKVPEMKITNWKNWEKRLENWQKAIIKYLDPDLCPYYISDELLLDMMELDIDWVKKTNIKWYHKLKKFKKKRYIKMKFKRICSRIYKLLFLKKRFRRLFKKITSSK